MKRFVLILLIFIQLSLKCSDVTIVGNIVYADGLGRIAINLIEYLHNKLNLSFVATRPSNFKDVPISVKKIATKPVKKIGKVSILFDLLWEKNITPANFVPNSKIKIAYSMLQTTSIPKEWVLILNNKFDAVVVPDGYYVTVYKSAGVKIPIFILPLGLNLENFYLRPNKSGKSSVFTFGISAGLFHHKNQELLIDAFIAEFGSNQNIRLRLHTRGGDSKLRERIVNKIQMEKASSIEFVDRVLNDKEYIDFMYSLDCYVLLSKGEGFSQTPREALALGIPCILSNNTAQTTICNTGLVYPVNSNIAEKADYSNFFGEGNNCGFHFNCNLADVRVALRTVYENYEQYYSKAQIGREWAKQFLYGNIGQKYLTLFKPKKVVLGNINLIDKDVLTTNSKVLYNKYLSIIKKGKRKK